MMICFDVLSSDSNTAIIKETCFIFLGKLKRYQESHRPTCYWHHKVLGSHSAFPRIHCHLNATLCTINLCQLARSNGIHGADRCTENYTTADIT